MFTHLDSASGSEYLQCPHCPSRPKITKMRHHIGYHMQYSGLSGFVCGVCGLRAPVESAGGNTCPVSITKTGQVSGICTHFGIQIREVIKSLKAAQKPSDKAPCTNVPIKCPSCALVIWRYQLSQHYTACHKDLTIPRELREVTSNERALLLKFRFDATYSPPTEHGALRLASGASQREEVSV